MACIVAMSMLAAGAPAAMAGEDTDSGTSSETMHALEDGEQLYLVFGAELGDQTLEGYLDEHVTDDPQAAADSSSAVSDVLQYQDVEQVNIHQQGNATSITVGGGEATAVQETDQYNSNSQEADSNARNAITQGQETQFEGVDDVYLVFGNSESQQFNGWGVADETGETEDVSQEAQATVSQAQNVSQTNVVEQSTAFALAVNESEATALQQTSQSNENLQQGVANASNVYLGDGEFGKHKKHDEIGTDSPVDSQNAESLVSQSQDIDQTNAKEAGSAVAIAVGPNSSATAIQLTEQTNVNEQFASADAANIFASMEGMNVATVESDAVETEGSMSGLDKKDKHKSISQTATAGVTQGQAVEQLNVNLQNTAMAIANNESEATAVQWARQQNSNAQIGYADALNIYAGPGYVHDSITTTESTTVTVGGDDIEDAPGLSFDYDTSNQQTDNEVNQEALSQIEQAQIVTQQNVNEQQTALAVAEDGGDASAAQVSLQENENVQFSSVAATSVIDVSA